VDASQSRQMKRVVWLPAVLAFTALFAAGCAQPTL
jgi:predicted small secreted protein